MSYTNIAMTDFMLLHFQSVGSGRKRIEAKHSIAGCCLKREPSGNFATITSQIFGYFTGRKMITLKLFAYQGDIVCWVTLQKLEVILPFI